MKKNKIEERLEGIKSSNLSNNVKNELHDFFFKLYNKTKIKPKYSANEWVNLENSEKANLFDERSRELRRWHDVVAASEFSNKSIKTYIMDFLSVTSNSYAHRRDHYVL